MPYELLPHTADLRVVVRGADLARLYASALDLVRDTLVDASEVRPGTRRRLDVPDGLPADERMFRFVRELLYLFDAEAFVPAHLDGSDDLVVWGETLDPSRHAVEHQVKAVTRHGYAFRSTAAGFEAEMILDL